MENTTSALLLFKDAKYRVSAILGLLKQAPVIEVKPEDINPIVVFTAENERFATRFEPDTADFKVSEIVFFKQEGKYTVLMGQTKAQRAVQDGQAVIKGRLVTSVGLKKAVVTTLTVPTVRGQEPTAIQQAFAKQIELKASEARSSSSRTEERPRSTYNRDTPPARRSPSPSNVTITRRGFTSRSGNGR